jgi:hypothetical protein
MLKVSLDIVCQFGKTVRVSGKSAVVPGKTV